MIREACLTRPHALGNLSPKTAGQLSFSVMPLTAEISCSSWVCRYLAVVERLLWFISTRIVCRFSPCANRAHANVWRNVCGVIRVFGSLAATAQRRTTVLIACCVNRSPLIEMNAARQWAR